MTIAIVCGGRNGRDFHHVHSTLARINPSFIKAGGANGYDTLAINAAILLGIPYRIYKADWDRYPRTAGPLRNRRMIVEDEPVNICIAFSGGRGTFNMMQQARRAGIRVIEVPPPITPAISFKPHFHRYQQT